MDKEIDINRFNYESYVIDYLDGNLNAVETACYIAFLENNPDIKAEIDSIDNFVLSAGDDIFEPKDELKKKQIIAVGRINENNFEDFFIAYYEGDLDDGDKKLLDEFLQKNLSFNNEFELFGKTRLSPPSEVVFKDKNTLKHRPQLALLKYASVAAAVVLLIVTWLLLDNNKITSARDKFALMNKLESRNNDLFLTSNIIIQIETGNRKVHSVNHISSSRHPNIEIQRERSDKFSISLIAKKDIAEQLTNPFERTRLIERNVFVADKKTGNWGDELAKNTTKGIDADKKKQDKGLLAKVFGRQIEKITRNRKIKINNPNKTNDPTYVKVIDKGLLVFNTITGSETATIKTYNRDGQLTGYQVEGHEVLLSRNITANSFE